MESKELLNIEVIKFEGNFNLLLNPELITQITDADNILRVIGSEDDTITSTDQDWVKGADQVIDLETYNSYSAGGATLLVDSDITQDIT